MIRNKVICHNVVSVHQKQMSAKQGLSPVSHSFFLVDRSEISLRMIILYMILWIRLQNVQSIRKLPRSPVCAGISALLVHLRQVCAGISVLLGSRRRVAPGCAGLRLAVPSGGGLAWYQNLWERLCGLAWYQNLSERQLSPPSIFLNSEVSTVMTG